MDTRDPDPRAAVTGSDRPTWLQRNWRWAFPTTMVLMIAAALGFTVLMLTVVMHPAKNSKIYEESLQRVRTHPVALEQLGSGIEPGWIVTGRSEETAGGRGVAELTIPVAGSKGDGELRVIGRRSEGIWALTRMELEIDDQDRRFDLLAP